MQLVCSKRTSFFLLTSLTLLGLLFAVPNAEAHSGRTDANGGHNCYVGSCAGTYHYHNGGGSTTPSTPNYVTQGSTNGKAHATRDVASIQSRTRTSGYQSGYSAGLSGAARKYYETHPATICEVDFTFDPGTNETYKSWYDLSYTSKCNNIARNVYMLAYDEGFIAGTKNKPTPASTATATSSADDSDDYAWAYWIVGLLGLGAVSSAWDKYKNKV